MTFFRTGKYQLATLFLSKSKFKKGGFISFQSRTLGSGLIFLLGSQLVYYGMRFNGSDLLRSPVWGLVSSIHSLIVYGLVAALSALALFVVLLIAAMILDRKPKTAMSEKDEPLPQVILSPEQIEKQRLRYEQMQKEAQEFMEQEKKRMEEKQKLEEQKKQEAIQRRRERSAEAVARDALDDFL